jgi:hypothetical protein
MVHRWLVGLLTALLLAGCGSELTRPRLSPFELVTPAELARVRAATDSVTAEGAVLRLSAYLWRDFMPVAPPGGGPLRVLLRIPTANSSPFPPALRADAAWILNGRDVWATRVRETRERLPGYPALDVSAEGGPRWGPGIEVDVVVRLRDAAGAAWYLGVKGQTIQRTE